MFVNEKVIKLIKQKDLSIPLIFFENYKKLKIEDNEFIFLIYLINENDLTFNPQKLSKILNLKIKEVLEIINKLVTKDLLKIEIKQDKKIHEEYLNLDNLYKKVALLVVNEDTEESINNNIFDKFEREFGRPLSPIEYELIMGWLNNKVSEELILLALKEAVYNGALSLRYIDRILFDWGKKGIKTAIDVEKSRINFKNNKKQEIFEYDWLNDEEENKQNN